MTQHEKLTATYYYPGSFFAEDVTVAITAPTFEAAVRARDDSGWFAVEIKRTPMKVFRSDDGEERTLAAAKPVKVGKWIVGEAFTVDEVKQYAEDTGKDLHILIANAEGNGWPRLCLTRRGNWQPVEAGDTVVAAQPSIA